MSNLNEDVKVRRIFPKALWSCANCGEKGTHTISFESTSIPKGKRKEVTKHSDVSLCDKHAANYIKDNPDKMVQLGEEAMNELQESLLKDRIQPMLRRMKHRQEAGDMLRREGVKICKDCHGYGSTVTTHPSKTKSYNVGDNSPRKEVFKDCPTCAGSGWQNHRTPIKEEE
jgi:DnaJ-class molecular chaperone